MAPDWAHGWEVLGQVLLESRDKQAAIDAFRTALHAAAVLGIGDERTRRGTARANWRVEPSEHFAEAARADLHDHASRSNLELVTQVGGGFVFFLAFRILVQSVGGWARSRGRSRRPAAGLVLLLVVREARTSRLPDDPIDSSGPNPVRRRDS